MSKFIVIKKKDLYIILLIVILVLAILYSSISYMFKSYTTLTKSTSTSSSNINKYDLDGDGISDDIEFSSNNKSYAINIKTANGKFLLETSDFGTSFIDISDSFNIKVQFYDLSRDGIPEIVFSGIKDDSVHNYIFYWTGTNFIELFSCDSNIFGLLNSKNSRCPNLLYSNSAKGDSSTSSLYYTNNSIKDTSFANNKIPSLDIIQNFIDTIELPYELDIAPDIFSSSISSEELAILWNLDKEQNNYSFQSGYFTDINWDSNGEVTDIFWTLSFRKYDSSKSTNNCYSELLLHLNITLTNENTYKIESIQK